jgi:nitrate/nitrite transport system ATP-binding protein
MAALITVDNITKAFPLRNGGRYVALKNIDLDIAEGEFVSLIGHSGCGKSTLLNLLAGLDLASQGGILMHGRQITAPGPERMVVFQNYSLLPWMNVRQNVALAVNNVMAERPLEERQELVETSLRLVRLSAAADKRPAELSGGMKQRVAIARALAIRPELLLLDEPFGALDALTRGNLQQQLMQICQEAGVTTVMVTHDVDEALLLSDRVVMLTNGPDAQIGQILTVPLPRPRERLAVMEHPDYYPLRGELMGFLEQQRRLRHRSSSSQDLAPATAPKAAAAVPSLAATQKLRLGYLPGLDVAPLALAIERGFLEAGGVKVLPKPFSRWQQLEEKLVAGELDAAITSATTAITLDVPMSKPITRSLYSLAISITVSV